VELTRAAVEAAVASSLRALAADAGDGWVSCLPFAHIGGLLVLLRGRPGGGPAALPCAGGTGAGGGFPLRLRGADPIGPGTGRRCRAARLPGSCWWGEGGWTRRCGPGWPLPGHPASVTYGLTQSCGGIVYDGTPLPGVSVRIDEGGEIQLGGPTLLRGYRDGSAAGLTADGWLPTGDAGRLDGDGRLHVHGRLDDLIVTGGENVWPGDVEAALRSHPAVADCAVFGRPDPSWGQRVVAAVVPRDRAAPPTLEELRDHVGALLGRHQAPRELLLVESLPRTALGKLQRGGLGEGAQGSGSRG
jgi:O-succinylbenzoic acid--CoA ligase